MENYLGNPVVAAPDPNSHYSVRAQGTPHDWLVTLGNGGGKPTRAGLTILYNEGKSQYHLERELAPEETTLIDFGKLIRNQVADKDGHTLPPDLTSGAYRVLDLNELKRPKMGTRDGVDYSPSRRQLAGKPAASKQTGCLRLLIHSFGTT
jgi:hypothetical protein